MSLEAPAAQAFLKPDLGGSGYLLKVKGISIIQWFCLDLLTVGIPIENSISEDFFRFAITQNLTDQSLCPSEYKWFGYK